MEAEIASLPSSSISSSSQQLAQQLAWKKGWKPIDSPAPSSAGVDGAGPATDGSTLTPEGSVFTEEVLDTGRLDMQTVFDRQASMPSAYTIDLDRSSGTRLGMSILEHVGQTLLITAVTGGLCADWNSTHRGQDTHVKPGDRIVGVNGVRGDTHFLLEECKKNQVLNMAIQRPPCRELAPGIHSVTLDKSGGMKLGIDISQHDSRTLLVTEIRDGLMKEWNRENPCHAVRPGDRIIKVNSCQNSATKLMEECRKNVPLTFAVKKAKVKKATVSTT